MKTAAALIVALLLPAGRLAAADGPWMLISRHGECHAIDPVLRHKFDDLPPIATPQALVAELHRRGVAASIETWPAPADESFLVAVPAHEMTLIFVPRRRCTTFAERRR